MIIQSKSNPKIKTLAALKEKKFRRERGEYLVEGVKMVRECAAAGMQINSIFCTQEYAAEFPQAELFSREVCEYVSDEKTPQGVIAAVKMPENILRAPQSSCILLDGLQDPGNVGTIIRTANAAGYGEIYMINCADPFSPKCVRASMSGVFFANIMQGDAQSVLQALSDTPIICADMHGEDVRSFAAPEKFCICIGSEGSGVSAVLRSAARYKVKIPMRPTCESLNAAVSAGILMYYLKFNAN